MSCLCMAWAMEVVHFSDCLKLEITVDKVTRFLSGEQVFVSVSATEHSNVSLKEWAREFVSSFLLQIDVAPKSIAGFVLSFSQTYWFEYFFIVHPHNR